MEALITVLEAQIRATWWWIPCGSQTADRALPLTAVRGSLLSESSTAVRQALALTPPPGVW